MSGTEAKFQVTITARDQASEVLQHIGSSTEALAKQLGVVNAEERALEVTSTSAWKRISEAALQAHGSVGALESGIGALHSRVSGMLPMLGALGGGMAIGGIFAATEKMAEKSIDAMELAQRVGIPGDVMARFKYFATMTRTDMDGVNAALEKFNDNLQETKRGKGAALPIFRELGIALKDKEGKWRPAGSLLGDLFKAWNVNPSAGAREEMGDAFFGKGGKAAMTRILGASPEDVERWTAQMDRLKPPTVGADQKKALRDYFETWQQMDVVVGNINKSVTSTFGMTLLPVLREADKLLERNQTEIGAYFGRKVTGFSAAMNEVNWPKTISEIEWAASSAWSLVNALGGVETVVGLIIAKSAFGFAAKFVEGFGAIKAAVVGVDAALEGSALLRLAGPAGVVAATMKPAQAGPDTKDERKQLLAALGRGSIYDETTEEGRERQREFNRGLAMSPSFLRLKPGEDLSPVLPDSFSNRQYRLEHPGGEASLNALANDPHRFEKLFEMLIDRISNIQPLAGGSFWGPQQQVLVTVRAEQGSYATAAAAPGSSGIIVDLGVAMPHLMPKGR